MTTVTLGHRTHVQKRKRTEEEQHPFLVNRWHTSCRLTYSLVGPAIERLRLLPVQRFIATDSVPIPTGSPFSLHVASLDALLAEAIRRLHGHLSLSDLIVHE